MKTGSMFMSVGLGLVAVLGAVSPCAAKEGAVEVIPATKESNAIYRPEKVDPELAKKDKPPKWYVLAGVMTRFSQHTPASLEADWRRASPAQRLSALRSDHQNNTKVWSIRALAGKPIFKPRSITEAMLKSATVPSWAVDTGMWRRSTPAMRRQYLERLVKKEAAKQSAAWSAKHKAELAAAERQYQQGLRRKGPPGTNKPIPVAQVPIRVLVLTGEQAAAYRPERVDPEWAKAKEPPEWYVAARLLYPSKRGKRYDLRKVHDSWRNWPTGRLVGMEGVVEEQAVTWAAERELGKPAFVPNLSEDAVQGDEPPPGVQVNPRVWQTYATVERLVHFTPVAVAEASRRSRAWDKQHAAELESARERLTAESRARGQAKEAEAQRAHEQALADYQERREAALKTVVDAKLLDLVNSPAKYVGKAVRVQARWKELFGSGVHLDSLSNALAVVTVAVTPPFRMGPEVFLSLNEHEWAQRRVFYENLKNAQVELVVLAGGQNPLAPGTAGRILSVKVR